MKKIQILLILMFSLILVGCQENNIIDEAENTGKVITMTAELPGSETNVTKGTRVALEPDQLDVKVTWKEGDEIDLYIVHGGVTSALAGVPVTPVAGNPSKCTFSFALPEGGTGDTFDLYGVYGGGGLLAGGKAQLPAAATSSNLNDLEEHIMLTFAETGISTTAPVKVNFGHIGSLFHIQLKNNSGGDLTGITKAELIANYPIQVYRCPDTNSPGTYNIVTREFDETTTDANTLSFDITSADLADGGVLDFWGWYPPVADKKWPLLGLRLTIGEDLYGSPNGKSARSSATESGKAYHFYATYGETDLKLTNQEGVADSDDIDYIFDARDGNIYKTVKIGDQIWMAENLKYLPEVVGPGISYDPHKWPEPNPYPYYYVYGYSGEVVADAKATDNYKTYGVLYNWPAALDACPDGWHLPTDKEWADLTTEVGDNPGSKLKETGTNHWIWNWWQDSATNSSGFTALPGGILTNSSFSNMGVNGFWWTSSESSDSSDSNAWYRYMSNSGPGVERGNSWIAKSNGASVRCVKD